MTAKSGREEGQQMSKKARRNARAVMAAVFLCAAFVAVAQLPPPAPGTRRLNVGRGIMVDLPPAPMGILPAAAEPRVQRVGFKPGTLWGRALDESGTEARGVHVKRLGNLDLHVRIQGGKAAIDPLGVVVYLPRHRSQLYFWDPQRSRWFPARAAVNAKIAGIRIAEYTVGDRYYSFRVVNWPVDDSDCGDGG
jgi:hypothetical protein